MTDNKQFCPNCGLAISAGSSGQGCPHCLLRLALTADEETDLLERKAKETLPLPSGMRSRFFGDYEVLEEISRGGMGVIYKARQLSLNRLVALKMIQASHLLSAEARLRFRMEVEAVAQLNHPHIVPLYESGEQDGTHYFTMRLVEGGTLADRIARGKGGGGEREKGRKEAAGSDASKVSSPLPPLSPAPLLAAAVAALLIKIARAVHHAHQRGILHRDLKPSNILIDPQGEPHVADFGLAKMLAQDSAATFTESILGSPNYMAPEQAAGQHSELTTATDVYGLGAILYEALTGTPPFHAATPVETIRKVLDEEPVAPRKLKPGVDAELETICLKCLQKKPAARYRTAEELADDLERWEKGLTIRARPVGPLGAAWRWSRRHPGFVLLGAALLVSLAALAVGATVAAWRVRSANQRTEHLVTRMQIQKAEDLFSEGETTKGLAMLAHVLRKEPAHAPATLRLLSALQHRSFALPVFPTVRQGSPLAAAGATVGEREWITLTLAGAARSWDLQNGAKLRAVFDLNRPVKVAAMSEDAKWMLIGLRDGTIELRQGPAFDAARELVSPRDGLEAAVFSPSGRLAAVASNRGQVRVWDTATGQVLTPPRQHPLGVTDLQFSRDESNVVTACADGQIRFWPVAGESDKPAQVLRQSACMLLRFDATGRWLAAGQHDGGIKVWDLRDTARAKWTLQHAHRINDLKFSADAGLLLSASRDDTARVWNLATGGPHAPPLRHGNSVETARFSPDERRVVTASGDNTARLWDTATGRPLTEEMPHESGLNHAAFTRDGHRVLTTAFSGTFVVWELREPFIPTTRIIHRDPVPLVQFSPDGARLASGSLDGELRITDARSGALLQRLQQNGSVHAIAFSPDGRWLATGGARGSVQLFDATNGQPILPLFKHNRAIKHLEFDPTGARLLTIAWDQAHLWDTASGQRIGAPLQHREIIHSARFSRDGRRVVTTSQDRTIRLWSGVSGEALGQPLSMESGATYAEFSPDGERILVALRGHVAGLGSIATGQPVGARMVHRGGVLHAAFNRDGTRIVTASEDQTAKLWSPDASEPLLHTLPHRARVTRAEFSPDGRTILTASSDGAVKLWDAASGHLIADPIQLPGATFACISPDGRRVAVSARDGSVFIRPVPVWDGGETAWLVTLAEQVARQRFTPPDRFDPLPRGTGRAPGPAALREGDASPNAALQDWLHGAAGK